MKQKEYLKIAFWGNPYTKSNMAYGTVGALLGGGVGYLASNKKDNKDKLKKSLIGAGIGAGIGLVGAKNLQSRFEDEFMNQVPGASRKEIKKQWKDRGTLKFKFREYFKEKFSK